MAKPDRPSRQVVAQNRKARHEFFINDTLEAGIVLAGSEVKSLRAGRASLQDAFAGEDKGELWLFNCYIPEYRQANRFNHETKRPRKLLVHRRELNRLLGAVKRKGVTLVPLQIYFNKRGLAKIDLGLAEGKQAHDKRETIKQRDWDREKRRLLKENR